MDVLRKIRLPFIYYEVGVMYVVATALIKWLAGDSWFVLIYILGAIIGFHLLDAVEHWVQIQPSPYRTLLFQAVFGVVSIFVLTSSSGLLGKGVVLALGLRILIGQIVEVKEQKRFTTWFPNVQTDPAVHKRVLVGLTIFFLAQTLIFFLV